jgi:CheY-like chemotaxis protein
MIYPLPALRVLCVDDDRDAADSTGLLLELYGCEVAVYYDGPTALAAARRFRPDLCLIDFSMPGMGGCELARRLRESTRGALRLIAVTAYGSDVARAATAAAGFDMHFVKPVDWDKLAVVMAETERSLGRAGNITARLARSPGGGTM